MSEDEKWDALAERIGKDASWTDRTLAKLDKIRRSSLSRQKKLDKANALLDDEANWLNTIAIPEFVSTIEDRWRDAIPTLQIRQSATAIRYVSFLGQCGLVLLKAATLL